MRLDKHFHFDLEEASIRSLKVRIGIKYFPKTSLYIVGLSYFQEIPLRNYVHDRGPIRNEL